MNKTKWNTQNELHGMHDHRTYETVKSHLNDSCYIWTCVSACTTLLYRRASGRILQLKRRPCNRSRQKLKPVWLPKELLKMGCCRKVQVFKHTERCVQKKTHTANGSSFPTFKRTSPRKLLATWASLSLQYRSNSPDSVRQWNRNRHAHIRTHGHIELSLDARAAEQIFQWRTRNAVVQICVQLWLRPEGYFELRVGSVSHINAKGFAPLRILSLSRSSGEFRGLQGTVNRQEHQHSLQVPAVANAGKTALKIKGEDHSRWIFFAEETNVDNNVWRTPILNHPDTLSSHQRHLQVIGHVWYRRCKSIFNIPWFLNIWTNSHGAPGSLH